MSNSNPIDENNPVKRTLPVAKVVMLSPPRRKLNATLELQVNIGGQDHNILLPLDAIREYDVGGPAVVAELRQIRESLNAFAMAEFSSKMDVLIDVLKQQKNQ